MTIVVENSADQVEAYTTGKGVFPIPADVAADNAKQEAKASANPDTGNGADKPSPKDGVANEAAASTETAAVVDKATDDDVEGEDGLTPRQKRDFTKAMQATIGRKHRMQREAEEYASTLYNNSKLAEERAAKLEADLAALKGSIAAAEGRIGRGAEARGIQDRSGILGCDGGSSCR